MQFRQGSTTNTNRLRLAVASPDQMIASGGTAWTYWDLTSATFGLGSNWMDYPDLAVGDNFLYVSVDEVGVGLFVSRISLTELRDGGTINFDYTTPSDGATAYGSHLVQNSGNGGFWAGHVDTSKLRVFSLFENSNVYSWRDVNIDSWSNVDITSTTPAGVNWLTGSSGFPITSPNGILGATRAPATPNGGSDELWFAWTAGRETRASRPQPYVRIARIRVDSFRYDGIYDIWNSDFAFAYPALATNADGEVGVSLGWGGNQQHSNQAAGFLGDYVVYYTALSDAAISRWGDYVSIRAAGTGLFEDLEFAATGYQVIRNNPTQPADCTGSAGCSFTPRFEVFRRPRIIIE
jgi:hypothetical protein